MLRSILLVVAALVGPLAQLAAAATEGTTALELCGTLKAHVAATAAADGSLRVGSRTYPVASGVTAGNGGVEVTVGRELCVAASVGQTSGRLLRYLFFPMLAGDRVCGNLVRPAVEDSFAMRADFGELTFLRGSPPAPLDNPGMRLCYSFGVDGTSGDLVATAKLPVRDNFSDREHVTKCGTVKAYVPATSATSGQITVGSRLFRIAAATPYTGDPAGDRTDRTTVGQTMCVMSTLDTGGAIVEYLTSAMPSNIAGTASAYTPPAGTAPGIAILSYPSRFELRIPVALDATIDLARSTYCFSTTVDGNGDMTASAVLPCPAGSVAGGGGTAGPATGMAPGPVHQCGTFVSYTPADAIRSGELVIGSTTFATSGGGIRPGSSTSSPGPFQQVIAPGATPGSQVCLDGTIANSETTANLLTDFTLAPAVAATASPTVGTSTPAPSAVPATPTAQPQSAAFGVGFIWLLVAIAAVAVVGLLIARARRGPTHS